jgi:hypothetical protein
MTMFEAGGASSIRRRCLACLPTHGRRGGAVQTWVDGEDVVWEEKKEEDGRKVCESGQRVDGDHYD